MVMHVRRPIPGMALLWHSSGAPIIAAYSTPLTPISLLVSAVTNPKSLWATPWWLALGEQMASVCWAAIKERKSAEQSERERGRKWVRIKGSMSCSTLLHVHSTNTRTHAHLHTHKQIDVCVCAHTDPCITASVILWALHSLNKNKCHIHPRIADAQQEHRAGLKSFRSYWRKKHWQLIPPQSIERIYR